MLEILIALLIAGKYSCDIDENTKGGVEVKAHPPTVILSIDRRF